MIIELVSIIIVSIAIITELLFIILWLSNFKSFGNSLVNFPSVDILIAARNEEDNIEACLDSLVALDYPKDKLNIWVGNDGSTDGTWQVIEKYVSKHSNLKGFQITEHTIKGNGKANVLAQLALKSHGDWIFITDADMIVTKHWVQAMLSAAEIEQAALVSGTSLVIGSNWLSKFQRLDWLYTTSMLKVVSDLGVPVTAIGNNMAITRLVYEEIGGFESLPFSVTEDLEIFKHVKKSHRTMNLFSAEVLNKSVPQKSIIQLLVQRKRWMRGAFELPIHLLGTLLIQAIYFPTIIILAIYHPVAGISFWLTKWLLKYLFSIISAKKLKEKVSIIDSFVSEWYLMLFSMASILYYFWPGKIYWKGRSY